MEYKYNDGGRSKYFKALKVRDCVTRAIAITSGRDYKEVYELVHKATGKTARNGVFTKSVKFKRLMAELGYTWTSCMGIGTGCTTHLKEGEIPMTGRIICLVSGHWAAVVDGVLNDNHDCSKGGTRCVYGYWTYNG